MPRVYRQRQPYVAGEEVQLTVPCKHNTPPDESHTCYHEYHSAFSEHNLPALLFQLDPPEFIHTVIPRLMENGEIVMDNEDNEIRDFWFLPRYISIRPPSWLIEFWMRTDPRLTYRDIKARMIAPVDDKPSDNTLNMRREREVRTPLGLSCWSARRGRQKTSRLDVERLERWNLDQIELNTTMTIEYTHDKSSPFPIPLRLRSKSLVPSDPVYYSLNHFVNNPSGKHIPSDRTLSVLSLFYELSELAASRGLASWKHLPAEDLPRKWKAFRNNGQPSSALQSGYWSVTSPASYPERVGEQDDTPTPSTTPTSSYSEAYTSSGHAPSSPVDVRSLVEPPASGDANFAPNATPRPAPYRVGGWAVVNTPPIKEEQE